MLFQLLLDSTLFVVTPTTPQHEGERTVQANQSVSLVTVTDGDGVVLPIFTSITSMNRWLDHPAGYLAMPSRAIFEMAAGGGTAKIVLDPGSPTGGAVTRYEIEQLARGRLPLGADGDIVTDATAVRIGLPTPPPTPTALDALRHQLRQSPSASEAWYYLMQQAYQPAELVIAIQFDPGADPQAGAMRQIIDGAAAAAPDIQNLIFVSLDHGFRRSLANGSGERFYTRA
jgi:hypothetical protein